MKKILYSIILSTALLTACGSNKVNSDINTVESSIDDEFQTIESELTDQINSISPYWDNFVKNVRVSQHNDGISVTVDINCHGFESIGQEFILVRNSVTEYAKVHDYPVSFISLNYS